MDEVPAFPGNLSPQKTKQRQFHRRKIKGGKEKKRSNFIQFLPCHGLTLSTKDTPFKKKYPEIKHSWREPKQPLSQPSFESDISNPTLVCSHVFSWKRSQPRNRRSSPSWKIIIFQGFQVQLWGFFHRWIILKSNEILPKRRRHRHLVGKTELCGGV